MAAMRELSDVEGLRLGSALVFQWAGLHWFWLALSGFLLAVVAVATFWDRLLDWDRGELWPLPAAILPACIPLARSLVETWEWSGRAEALIVVGLLLAIGGLQLYGQQRNARERIKTETRFAEQTAIIESGFDSLNSRLLGVLSIIARITEEEKKEEGANRDAG